MFTRQSRLNVYTLGAVEQRAVPPRGRGGGGPRGPLNAALHHRAALCGGKAMNSPGAFSHFPPSPDGKQAGGALLSVPAWWGDVGGANSLLWLLMKAQA